MRPADTNPITTSSAVRLAGAALLATVLLGGCSTDDAARGDATNAPARVDLATTSDAVLESEAVKTSMYARAGGDPFVRALADRFYDRVEGDERFKLIDDLHVGPMGATREHFYQFASQFLGGPPLYTQAHGPARMRRRHLDVPIDTATAEVWLACMDETLDELVADDALRAEMKDAYRRMAMHFRNTPDA